MGMTYFTSFDIRPGTKFDTDFEEGCIALTSPDDLDNFDALDSDGVRCNFALIMVRVVHPA